MTWFGYFTASVVIFIVLDIFRGHADMVMPAAMAWMLVSLIKSLFEGDPIE